MSGNGIQGQWVEISQVIIEAGSRAPQVPKDTAQKPLVMKVKGFLQRDGKLGEQVTIKTVTGRILEGKLKAINPEFKHDFGEPQELLLEIGMFLRGMVFKGVAK
jgi:hypothetical protein